MESVNVDEIKRRAQRSFYEDGLFDVFLGAYLLAFAIIAQVDFNLVVFLGLPLPLLAVGNVQIKERYVYPRMGYAKYPDHFNSGGTLWIIGLLGVFIGVFGSFFVLIGGMAQTGWNIWFAWIAPLAFGGLMGSGPIIVAKKLQIKRYYVYSVVMILLSISVPIVFASPTPGYASLFSMLSIEYSIPGAIAILIGLTLFIQFIRKYPLPATNTAGETQE